jgi:hypothetical protein
MKKDIKIQVIGNSVIMSVKDFVRLLKEADAEIDTDLPGKKATFKKKGEPGLSRVV